MTHTLSNVPSVLLVEDNTLTREILKHILGAFGCDIVGEATSQKAALACYRELLPDLVLLDIRLPLGNGVDALGDILALAPDAYVVMLTAMDDQATRQRCKDLGAKGFVAKGRGAEEMMDDLDPHIAAVSTAP